MTAPINTHHLTISTGRHKGERFTRLPVSYLKWMVNVHHHQADIALAELDRRGTTTPKLEVSGHAIDRASLRYRWLWHETALNKEEGLHAWLVRIAEKCLAESDGQTEKIKFNKMKLVFEMDGCWPVLKTVM